MRRQRQTAIEQLANAVIAYTKIDIHQCQYCGERLCVGTEVARNDDRDITVYCPNCQVGISADCPADEIASVTQHLCEAHAQLARQAKANGGVLCNPRGLYANDSINY